MQLKAQNDWRLCQNGEFSLNSLLLINVLIKRAQSYISYSEWYSELPWHCGWSVEKQVGRRMWGRRQKVWRAGGCRSLPRLPPHRRSSLLLPRSHWPCCFPRGPCAAARESCRGCCVESYWPYWRQKKKRGRKIELREEQRKLFQIS